MTYQIADQYEAFLSAKVSRATNHGFTPLWMPSFLFDFQQALVEWAIERGRAAIFADCGLGKTPMQLVWAENIVQKTNRPVLLLTPLAVAQQTMREGHKFSIQCRRSSGEASAPSAEIIVTNYEKLHHFDPSHYAGIVADESSILKSFAGKRRIEITEFMKRIPYRLLCTATAAPNDYIELGTSSEAIGELGYMDMLGRFFVNDQHSSHPNRQISGAQWRFKGHAEQPFWRWICSWARSVRRPSDLGFSDDRFALPTLTEREHVVEARTLAPGMLFSLPARDMFEEREERRRTISERCEAITGLVKGNAPAVVWCHLNDEGDLLEEMIADARQVSGSDSDERKEEVYEAFATGKLRVIVIKPKIGAWGLNWQHCAHVVTFASHSYEQYYQSVRRCWRFGQTRPVNVDIVASEGELRVAKNLSRKAAQCDKMFSELVRNMRDELRINYRRSESHATEMPEWL